MMKHILFEGGYRWCFYHRDSLHGADRNRSATLEREALAGGRLPPLRRLMYVRHYESVPARNPLHPH